MFVGSNPVLSLLFQTFKLYEEYLKAGPMCKFNTNFLMEGLLWSFRRYSTKMHI